MSLILITVAFYLLMLGDLELTAIVKSVEYRFKFNGLIWCILDLGSIIRYDSFDEPIKFISFKKTIITNE